jgi:hypothetical protein
MLLLIVSIAINRHAFTHSQLLPATILRMP